MDVFSTARASRDSLSAELNFPGRFRERKKERRSDVTRHDVVTFPLNRLFIPTAIVKRIKPPIVIAFFRFFPRE